MVDPPMLTRAVPAEPPSFEGGGRRAGLFRYVDVVVDVPTDKPGDTFTYAVPTGMRLAPGHLVRVPFGRRTVGGVVVGGHETTTLDYTKPVASVVQAEPVLTATQLILGRWVSQYYATPLFESLAPMLPPGHRSASQATLNLKAGNEPAGDIPQGARQLWAYLKGHPRPQYASSLARRLGPWVPNAVRALDRAGLLEERWPSDSVRPSRPTERAADVLRLVAEPARAAEWAGERERRAPRQAALAHALAETHEPYRVVVARREFGSGAVAGLIEHGIAELVRLPAGEIRGPSPEPARLPTPPQAEALRRIRAALDTPALPGRSFLLRGVTGSGKTEVYLQAIAHVLAQGRRAIVLVPELSLTPQTLQRFEARFPGRVASLHSGLTPAQQWAEWWRVRRGEAGIVIGSRGAVFAPQPDLGLIVLDEEHEWTYKQQDASPRYHSRSVALKLAELTGAVVVMGSATPDIETAFHAASGRHRELLLPERIEDSGAVANLADVSIVDMRQELRAGNRSVFSRELREALVETLVTGRQAMLFLNRRGSASVVECRNCGYVARCHRCGTAYTYHAGQGNAAHALVCHQCNHQRRVPSTCPKCHSTHIRYLGLGTQQLVDYVQALLPDARVLRWDRDSATTVRAHTELLERFTGGEADILVGTQMIAKGLHLPAVTLVGVVLADIGLHVPDFRAAERTFQVLTQVAGRAGRGTEPGRVVVQTYVPDHYAIRAAASQSYENFYDQELGYRRGLGEPPYARLIKLSFAHSNELTARREAQRVGAQLRREARAWGMADAHVIGPVPAYPPRLRGTWRWQLVVRGPEPRQLVDKIELPPAWVMDVDPASVT